MLHLHEFACWHPERQEGREMMFTVRRVVTAGAVVALLGIGGAGYAYAQSGTTTPPGNSPSTNNGGGTGGGQSTPNCPNMGGGSSASSTSASNM